MQNPNHCPNCDTRIAPGHHGDFFGCCSWTCLQEQKQQAEARITAHAKTLRSLSQVLPGIANPFGQRRGAI